MHSMLTKQSVGTRPARLSSPAAAAPQRSVRAAAAAPKSGLASYADSIGLPTDEGVFGFKPFAEAWTGRYEARAWRRLPACLVLLCTEFTTKAVSLFSMK